MIKISKYLDGFLCMDVVTFTWGFRIWMFQTDGLIKEQNNDTA